MTRILSAVIAAVTLTASAQYEPMASKALLDKRIFELNTNLTAQIDKLKNEVAAISNGGAETNGTGAADILIGIEKTKVLAHMATADAAACTYAGEYFADATDARYKDLHLVWDRIERNPYCATNAQYKIAMWDLKRPGQSDAYTITTADGETYTNANIAATRTFVCTTNATRIIVSTQCLVDAEAWRAVMGIK